MLARHFSHYCNRRCRRMVFELAGVISPSCLDHTKLPVRFEPWNRWGLCWEICIVTNWDADGWCLNWPVISPSCLDHTKLPVRFEPCNRWGLCWEIYNVTNGDSDGWCQQWLVWSTPHSLISWNPGERMFVGQISLLVASLSPLYHGLCHYANWQRSQPTSLHCAMCQYVECRLIFLLYQLLGLVALLVHGSATLFGKA